MRSLIRFWFTFEERVGATSAYWFNIRYAASSGETRQVVLATFVVSFWGIVAFAIEGAICLLMLTPLALAAGFCGGWAGRGLAQLRLRTAGEAMIAVIALPLAMLTQPAHDLSPGLREVRSSIEVDAAPHVVWRNVIAFSPLSAPTEFVFRSGISYPIGARIVGEGVGAVRYCEFSTGAFVEPITAWEPSRRLAFDVVSQPAPLREWSPGASRRRISMAISTRDAASFASSISETTARDWREVPGTTSGSLPRCTGRCSPSC